MLYVRTFSPQKEAVFVHFGFYFVRKLFEALAQCGYEGGVTLVVAVGVHLAARVRALEVQAYVVERGVGVGTWLRVVVTPQLTPRVHYGLCLG